MAGFSWKLLLSVFGQVLGPLLGLVSSEIKKLLTDFLTELYVKALATPNPWDDMLVGLLLDVLSIPRPPPAP